MTMKTWSVHRSGATGITGEKSFQMWGINGTPKTGRKAIIALHGHGATCLVWQPGWAGADHVQYLADQGYMILSVDAGGPTTWNNQPAADAITAAYNYLLNFGINGTKIGLFGWSMGGGNALEWIKQNPTKVSCAQLWAPMTNLGYFYGQGGTYQAEIDAAYSAPNYVSGGYVENSPGHKIADEFATWRNKCPIHLNHGDADSTVSYTLSQAFVNGVNQPQVGLTILPGFDHSTVFSAVPVATTKAFFDAGVWT